MTPVELPQCNPRVRLDWSAVYRGELQWLPARTILLAKGGSHAYGTSTPTSDIDYRGVCVAPRDHYLGFLASFDQCIQEAPADDLIITDVRKFMRLAADNNPTMIELLYADESEHLVTTNAGSMLLANRDLFLSQKARHSFTGFAVANIKRIQTQDPTGDDAAKKNGKRAMQFTRLYRMAREIMTDGTVNVKRKDAAELLDIRNGRWDLNDLIAWGRNEDLELADLAKTTSLPHAANRKRLNEVCVAIVESMMRFG